MSKGPTYWHIGRKVFQNKSTGFKAHRGWQQFIGIYCESAKRHFGRSRCQPYRDQF